MIGILLAAALEIRIPDFLWKSPGTLHGVLGKKQSSGECADASDALQIVYQRGYVCTRKNRIIVFSREFSHDVSSPEEALTLVGLRMTAQPFQMPNGSVFLWSAEHNNALRIGNIPATRVIAVISGGTRGVTVDVGGD